MGKTNPIFQVLVSNTSGATPLAKGSAVSALAEGQYGVFDADTNLSVDATSTSLPKNVYIALGSGNPDDPYFFSSGQNIQIKNVVNANKNLYTAPVNKVMVISDVISVPDTDYVIHLEFRNQEIYRTQGYNGLYKSFVIKTDKTAIAGDPLFFDPNILVRDLVNAVNLDEDGLVVAEAINAAGTTVTDMDAFIATNSAVNTNDDKTDDVLLRIKLTAQPLAMSKYFAINAKYFDPRQTDMLIALKDGFEDNGTVTVTQEMKYSGMTGYDLQHLEYEAGGWNGRPGVIRQYSFGLAKNELAYYAVKGTNYDVITISCDFHSNSGVWTHSSDNVTYIAFPTGSAQSTALIAILAKIGIDVTV